MGSKYLILYHHYLTGKKNELPHYDWGWADTLDELRTMIQRILNTEKYVSFHQIVEIESSRNIMYSHDGSLIVDHETDTG